MGIDHYAQLRAEIQRATAVYLQWSTDNQDYHVRITKTAATGIVNQAEKSRDRLTITIFGDGSIWIDHWRGDDGWIDRIGC